jgi:hypothetical protein
LGQNLFTKHFFHGVSREITGHGGRIIIVGDPRFNCSTTDESRAGSRLKTEPFLKFTDGAFVWDLHGGDSVNVANIPMLDRVCEYLRHLRWWNYSLREAVIYGSGTDVLHTAFARNRYEQDSARLFDRLLPCAYNRTCPLRLFGQFNADDFLQDEPQRGIR